MNFAKRLFDYLAHEAEEEAVHDDPRSFEIIYGNRILGQVGYVPIIGDTIFGYTVWEVDYYHRYAYVTK